MSDRILRKRSAPAPAEVPATKKTSAAKPKKTLATKVAESVKETVTKAEKAVTGKTNGAAATTSKSKDVLEVGDSIDIATFGGEFETNDGDKVTFKELLEKSEAGVVLFTYPKASTPGW
jgi:peroxiredoxin Q/BCP